jgi:hypothetical protein
MGKRGAQERLYRGRAAECESDDAARLKRLTRTELIRLIAKLEALAPNNERGVHNAVSRHSPTMLVNESVRSGQRLTFEEGDLIVVGSVGSGAEIVAGGSIHIYGALRGRASAGTSDQLGARIFCQKFEAESLAIGGICRMSDDFDTNLRGCPAHAWRDANDIRLAALSKLENPQNQPENMKASLGPREASVEILQGASCAPAQNTTAARFNWARPLSWMWRLTSMEQRANAPK